MGLSSADAISSSMKPITLKLLNTISSLYPWQHTLRIFNKLSALLISRIPKSISKISQISVLPMKSIKSIREDSWKAFF